MFGSKSNADSAIHRITVLAVFPLAVALIGVLLYAFIPAPAPRRAMPVATEFDVEIRPDEPRRENRITTVSFEREVSEDEAETSSPTADSGAADNDEDAENADSGTSADEPERLSISLQQVDNLIREGNYPLATELLAEFAPQVSGLLKVRIQLRRGLCAELEGHWQTALVHYRSLTDSHSQTAISDAAAVATARVLIERGRRDVATAMLMRLLLSREQSMRKELLGDVVHTLASGLAPVTRQHSLLNEDEWLTARHTSTPEGLLKSWGMLDAGKRLPLHQDVLNVRQLTDDPSGVLVSLESESATVASVLQRVTQQIKWRLDVPESLIVTLQSRTMMFDCSELPLDVVLDAMLKSNSLTWSFQDQTISVLREDHPQANDGLTSEHGMGKNAKPDVLQAQLMSAERFQQLAINLAPEHSAAAVSYLLLGATVAKKGEVNRSIQLLRTAADTFPRSSAIGAMHLCLGKALLISGDRENALKHFYKTVDRVSGIETDTVAYLYIGRMLIENDTARDAVSPLMRALSLSEETIFEAPAALLLAAAYLQNGNAAAANSVLLNHRLVFEAGEDDPEVLSVRTRQLATQAALISSLSRFWGSNGTQRIREGRALLSSLTTTNADEWFGGHGAYLAGVAFAAVGLDSQRNAVFTKSLMGDHQFPLQAKMTAMLSGDLNYEKSLSASVAVEKKTPGIAATVPGTIPKDRSAIDRTLLLKNEAAFRYGRHDEVLAACQIFLKDRTNVDSDIRKPMLRLMGLVYQIQGQHQLAIRCLAGIAPTDDNTAERSATTKDSQL